MGGGHNRRELSGEGAKRPPPKEVSSTLFGSIGVFGSSQVSPQWDFDAQPQL